MATALLPQSGAALQSKSMRTSVRVKAGAPARVGLLKYCPSSPPLANPPPPEGRALGSSCSQPGRNEGPARTRLGPRGFFRTERKKDLNQAITEPPCEARDNP